MWFPPAEPEARAEAPLVHPGQADLIPSFRGALCVTSLVRRSQRNVIQKIKRFFTKIDDTFSPSCTGETQVLWDIFKTSRCSTVVRQEGSPGSRGLREPGVKGPRLGPEPGASLPWAWVAAGPAPARSRKTRSHQLCSRRCEFSHLSREIWRRTEMGLEIWSGCPPWAVTPQEPRPPAALPATRGEPAPSVIFAPLGSPSLPSHWRGGAVQGGSYWLLPRGPHRGGLFSLHPWGLFAWDGCARAPPAARPA